MMDHLAQIQFFYEVSGPHILYSGEQTRLLLSCFTSVREQ